MARSTVAIKPSNVNHQSFWSDESGILHSTPRPGLLEPTKRGSHRELRRFVFYRDRFTCAECGASPVEIPNPYTGRYTVFVIDKNGRRVSLAVDHIIPRHAGGPNHPSNLQALCDSCNSRKAGHV